MTTEEIIQIIRLAQDLTPTAVKLIMELMADLKGRPDDDLLNEADAIFARVRAKALAAKG